MIVAGLWTGEVAFSIVVTILPPLNIVTLPLDSEMTKATESVTPVIAAADECLAPRPWGMGSP
jgi:hypothetical protein